MELKRNKIRNTQYAIRDTKYAFTLVEILIVVAILGILAAITLPTLRGHIAEAKEAAAKDNLRILRNAIEFYAAQHNGIPPGYIPGWHSGTTYADFFILQLCKAATNADGQTASPGTPGFPLGPYVQTMPLNPFNKLDTIKIVADDTEFPPDATGEFGWIYQAATHTIRIDWTSTDREEVRYYDY